MRGLWTFSVIFRTSGNWRVVSLHETAANAQSNGTISKPASRASRLHKINAALSCVDRLKLHLTPDSQLSQLRSAEIDLERSSEFSCEGLAIIAITTQWRDQSSETVGKLVHGGLVDVAADSATRLLLSYVQLAREPQLGERSSGNCVCVVARGLRIGRRIRD